MARKKENSDFEDFDTEDSAPKGIGDMFKKIASVGMGAAFMTEESIRGLLHDLPVSKEIIAGLVQNAKGAKEDFTKGIQEEFGKYLSKIDKESLIDYIVENYDVEVNASFKLKKKKSEDSPSKKS
jgi:hypothetical protein